MLSFKEIRQLEKQKKARDSLGLFVTEGRKLFEEAPRELIREVLVSRRYEQQHPEVREQIPDDADAVFDIEDSRFASVSDTKTPQGILTVVEKPSFRNPVTDDFESKPHETGEASSPLYLILENLQDPGNAGTIIRTAEAAGVTAVFITEGSVDLYAPKTIRSTMGSIYRVPHFLTGDAVTLIRKMHKNGVTSFAAHLRGDRAYTACDFRSPAAIVIGNEGNGITDETADACSVLMKIPMKGRVESLNAAMAAGILMYEAARQRG